MIPKMFYTILQNLMHFSSMDKVIQEDGLYV